MIEHIDRFVDAIFDFGKDGGWKSYVATAIFTVFLIALFSIPMGFIYFSLFIGSINTFLSIVVGLFWIVVAVVGMKKALFG